MLPSNLRFGAFLAGLLATAAAYWGWRHGIDGIVAILLLCSAAVAALAWRAPSHLRGLKLAWYRLGLLLGRVVSPLVLGIIWIGMITPVALIGRLLGRDELRLRPRPGNSHWVDRDPPGPAPDSFTRQF